ncbi:MAG: hypothetical protein Q7S68_04415, partial [Deltaproteobacteria bacterium]|nr:hypothetical protein [Deltaproteobacteria bacterium]
MPRPLPLLECEEGGEFLCVNTPLGSIKENFVIIKGRLNATSSTAQSLSISLQHEYTREIQNIALATPLTENCWERSLTSQQNFCLEGGGKFSIYLPLAQLGPYTILVTASEPQGSSIQKTVRTSSVIVPTFTPDILVYDPILSSPLPSGTSHVRVTMSLLKDCMGEACDFIGASTGGVSVIVENTMSSQRARNIRCATNVIQGGPGQFSIGVPVQPGTNQLKITVCNAATGFDPTHCPQINSPSFQVGGGATAIEILSSSPLQFKISNHAQTVCDDSVRATFNLDSPKSICPNVQGIYEAAWNPKEGYNIAGIEVNQANQKITKAIMFTSGKILSPFNETGEIVSETDRRLKEAVQLHLPKDLIQETAWSTLQRYLKSPTFEQSLQEWTDAMGRGPAPQRDNEEQNIEIPFCPKEAGGGGEFLRIKVTEPPRIGKIDLGDLKWHAQKLETSIKAKDVSLSIQLYKDVDGDGRPDIDPLPLKIVFKELELNPSLEVSGRGDSLLVKLSSPDTDCAYKRRGACFSMPALFVPQKFEG